MRITNNMMINTMMRNINRNIVQLDKRQMQVSTGKKIHRPSDDPIAISRSLKLKADIYELDQYKKNVDDAVSWLETTEIAINNIGAVLQRLRDLTVQASNGVLTPEDTQKIRGEVEQLKEQLISLGNTTYSGKYIFSGKKTNEELFDASGSYNVNLTNDPDPAIADDKIKFEIGIGETMEINILGFELFGGETAGAVTAGDMPSLISILDDIIGHLNAGDTTALGGELNNIDTYLNRINTVRSEIGGKVNRMELIQNRIADDRINYKNLLSKLEDADMAEVIMQFTNEENVYRASLAVGARIIQPSLLDFLR